MEESRGKGGNLGMGRTFNAHELNSIEWGRFKRFAGDLNVDR